MTLTLEQINAIEAGCEGVTPGPWDQRQDGDWGKTVMGGDGQGFEIIADCCDVATAKHIASLDPTKITELCRLAKIGLVKPDDAYPEYVTISRVSLESMYRALQDADEDGMTEHADCMVEAREKLHTANKEISE